MVAYPDAAIMVFCKAPIPGQVKTRLTPHLSTEQAMQLHKELTEQTLQTATSKRLCDVQLWCSPTVEHRFFSTLANTYNLSLHAQQGVDLGERMHFAFSQALACYQTAVIVGCDCPSLINEDFEQALCWLQQGASCALAPAEDGGYVLIGLNQPQLSLFTDMPWGTDKVLSLTRNRLKALDIEYKELPYQWDIDTPADLKRYRNNE